VEIELWCCQIQDCLFMFTTSRVVTRDFTRLKRLTGRGAAEEADRSAINILSALQPLTHALASIVFPCLRAIRKFLILAHPKIAVHRFVTNKKRPPWAKVRLTNASLQLLMPIGRMRPKRRLPMLHSMIADTHTYHIPMLLSFPSNPLLIRNLLLH